jgi:hypothetical protein
MAMVSQSTRNFQWEIGSNPLGPGDYDIKEPVVKPNFVHFNQNSIRNTDISDHKPEDTPGPGFYQDPYSFGK